MNDLIRKQINYAELNCITNFSFLKGASHPEELVETAALNGYSAIAITDECSFSGIIRAYKSAKKYKIKIIVGSEFKVQENLSLVLIANSKRAYEEISSVITKGRSRGLKGDYVTVLDDMLNLNNTIAIINQHALKNVINKINFKNDKQNKKIFINQRDILINTDFNLYLDVNNH